MRLASICTAVACFVYVSCSAAAAEWSGTMACGELQNSPNAKLAAGFSGPVTLRIEGRKAVLDRTMKVGQEHLEGIKSKGKQLQLEGRGWLYARVDRPWKVRTTLKEKGSGYEGAAVFESLDGQTRYRDCSLSLTGTGSSKSSQTVAQAAVTKQPNAVTANSKENGSLIQAPSKLQKIAKAVTSIPTKATAKVSAIVAEIPQTQSKPLGLAQNYRVVPLRTPTAAELVQVKKSNANQFLADGNEVKIASVDLDDDGVPELVVISQSSVWCGSGGCASKVLKIAADSSIRSFDNDCMYFGASDAFGLGNTKTGSFATLLPLDMAGKVAIMDKEGLPNTGRPIVCAITPSGKATKSNNDSGETLAPNSLSPSEAKKSLAELMCVAPGSRGMALFARNFYLAQIEHAESGSAICRAMASQNRGNILTQDDRSFYSIDEVDKKLNGHMSQSPWRSVCMQYAMHGDGLGRQCPPQ